MTETAFKKLIWSFYHTHKRDDLPWRRACTPYKIAVSEIMLQQTQVDRVVSFFKTWIKTFPNFKSLANAPQKKVLSLWKGLGYNSRALRLQKLAQQVVEQYHGKLPKTIRELVALPGIGPYTAGAILAFVHDIGVPIIETNIRTVYMYHFFRDNKQVSDKEILALVERTLPKKNVREWYWALMDYGAYLKKTGVQINAKSRHYAKQSKFEGSNRQLRGKTLAMLLEKNKMTIAALAKTLGEQEARMQSVVHSLEKEGFITRKKSVISLVGK